MNVLFCMRVHSIVSQSLPWISLCHQCWAVHIAWRSHYKGMARRADRVRMQSGIGNTMQSRALSTQSQKLLGIDNPCSLSWYLSRGLENPRPLDKSNSLSRYLSRALENPRPLHKFDLQVLVQGPRKPVVMFSVQRKFVITGFIARSWLSVYFLS